MLAAVRTAASASLTGAHEQHRGSTEHLDAPQRHPCSCSHSLIFLTCRNGRAHPWFQRAGTCNARTDQVTSLLVDKVRDWRTALNPLDLSADDLATAQCDASLSVRPLQGAEERALLSLSQVEVTAPSLAQVEAMENRLYQCTRCSGGMWHDCGCLVSPHDPGAWLCMQLQCAVQFRAPPLTSKRPTKRMRMCPCSVAIAHQSTFRVGTIRTL